MIFVHDADSDEVLFLWDGEVPRAGEVLALYGDEDDTLNEHEYRVIEIRRTGIITDLGVHETNKIVRVRKEEKLEIKWHPKKTLKDKVFGRKKE